ncbi:MAG: cation diffusion facilitator family transporter [Bdellovibrionota bacterium]
MSSGDHHDCDHAHGHAHEHGHGSHHHHHHAVVDNIKLAFALNFCFAIVELIGGLWIGSLAIVADAIHDAGDSVSLGVAWFLEKLANKRGDSKFNFGYRRFSLLSALVSGIVITVGSTVIVIQAIQRFADPHVPAGLPMMGLAILGIAVNGLAAFRLSRGSTSNEKMLTWHLVEDMAGWGVVLIGGGVIYLTGWPWVDPVLALGLAIFVAFNVLRRLRETAYLFLQGRPQNFDEARFIEEAMAVSGVEHVDHLAVWSLDGETSILSARLHLHSVRDPLAIETIKEGVRSLALKQRARATLETCLHEKAPHPSEN